MASSLRPSIVVHGGAGTLDSGILDFKAVYEAIQGAAAAGYRQLTGDGQAMSSEPAVEAVQAAVCFMEDNPLFNAGIGSALTVEGTVEMDAVIMEGKVLRTGGVGCVKNIKNPVSLARMVMDKTDHILLVGDGANAFAKKMNVPEIPSEELITERTRQVLEKHREFSSSVQHLYKDKPLGMDDHDTVGAVAVDVLGNVACATSTGGICLQMIGRVGDSPLIGSGAYCDNSVGAVSTTGHGEAIAKVTLARNVIFYMDQGMSPRDALEKGLKGMKERLQSQGGAIAVSKDGDIGYYFNTTGMAWASVQNGQMHYGIYPGEDVTKTYGAL